MTNGSKFEPREQMIERLNQ